MLIQLLQLVKTKKTYTLQELDELTNKDIDSVKMELEYLEDNGHIKKIDKKEI